MGTVRSSLCVYLVAGYNRQRKEKLDDIVSYPLSTCEPTASPTTGAQQESYVFSGDANKQPTESPTKRPTTSPTTGTPTFQPTTELSQTGTAAQLQSTNVFFCLFLLFSFDHNMIKFYCF